MHILDRCEKFLYGGCGGNHNNFYNASDCLSFCQGTQNIYIYTWFSLIIEFLREATKKRGKGWAIKQNIYFFLTFGTGKKF